MRIPFEKYHGTGNDFVLIDIRDHSIPEDVDTIAKICHRRYDIGADGLNIRTFERGLEVETLSYGTGVTAEALAWPLRKHIEEPIKVMSLAGLLNVHFSKKEDHFTYIYLEGLPEHVFSGEPDI